MRSPRLMHNRLHLERWPQYAVWIAQNNLSRYDLLGSKDHIACSEHCLLAYAYIAPQMRIALFVTSLHMNDGNIGPNCRHQQQRRSIQWRLLLEKHRILARNIAAQKRMR